MQEKRQQPLRIFRSCLMLFVLAMTFALPTVAQAAAMISGVVYNDYNNGGNSQAFPVAGTIVGLYDGANTELSTATTAADGSYNLSVTNPGSYKVKVKIAPAGYQLHTTVSLGEKTVTSDGSTPSANNNLYIQGTSGKISGKAFIDMPTTAGSLTGLNDTFGAGDVAMTNVVINLTIPGGKIISIATNGSGDYVFDHLPPGAYTVASPDNSDFQSASAAFWKNTANWGLTIPVTLSGTDVTGQNFWGRPLNLSGITGRAVNDINGDKAYTTGQDLLLAGPTATLYHDDGTTLVTTVSPAVINASGIYEFKPLPIGNYIVKATTTPANYTLSQPTTSSLAVSLASTTNPSAENNFYYTPGNGLPGITGYIFGDDDGNYTRSGGPDSGGTAFTAPSAGDTRFANVKVDLYRKVGGVWEATPFLTQKTKTDGSYAYKGLPGATDYRVVMDPAGVDSSYAFMNDRDGKSIPKGNAPFEITGGLTNLSALKIDQNFWYGKKGTTGMRLQGWVYTVNNGFPWGGIVNNVPSNSAWAAAQFQVFEEDGLTPATYGNGTPIPLINSTNTGGAIITGVTEGLYTIKLVPGSYDPRLTPMSNQVLFGAYIGDTGNAVIQLKGVNTAVTGKVFVDLDGDNAYTAGVDTPMSGASVRVYEVDGGGTIIRDWGIMGTTANGDYNFTNLPSGKFIINIPSLAYLQGAMMSQIVADPLVPLFNPNYPSVPFDLSGSGATNENIWYNTTNTDFYISGTTWMDIFGDGTINRTAVNRNDSRLFGVTLELLDSTGATVLATQTSDINGNYKFSGLSANTTYQVRASKASMTVFDTSASDGPIGGGAVRTVIFGANPGIMVAQDFLLRGPGRVNAYVFDDVNGNGAADSGEVPAWGYYILQEKVGGNWVQLGMNTATSWNQTFANLEPGDYRIRETNATNTVIGHTYPSDDPYAYFTITTAGENITTNFIQQWSPMTGAVTSGNVWLDVNGNGIIDAGDIMASGLSGAQVKLYKSVLFNPTYNTPTTISASVAAGASYAASVNSDGTFSTTNVMSTNYFMQLVNLPSGYTAVGDIDGATAPNQAWLPSFLNGGGAGVIQTPVNNSGIIGRDFLISRNIPIEISGKVFYDANADGIYNSGDQPMGTVTIELYKNGTLLTTQSTISSDGTYKFTNLPDENYEVKVNRTGVAADLILSGDFPTSYPNLTISGAGGTYKNEDFAFIKDGEAGISGRVAVDINNTGAVELPVDLSGDLALAGVQVDLYQGATLLRTATTNSKGIYSFTGGLAAGTYTVKLNGVGLGTYQAFANATGTSPINENQNIVLSSSIVSKQDFLVAGTSNTNPAGGKSGGTATNSGIMGHLFVDVNHNQAYDSGTDTPLVGVQIKLVDVASGNTVVAYTTGTDGKYQFYNLNGGSYKVSIDSATPGYIIEGNRDGNTTETLNVSLSSTGVNQRDFWFKAASQKGIEGYIYYDALRDSVTATTGTVNSNDLPLAGVVLELYSGIGSGAVTTGTTVTTGADGKYAFPGLIYGPSANYTVKVKTLPTGYANYGSSVTGTTAPLGELQVLALPQAGVDSKFFFMTGIYTLGDLVWKDVNGNNVYDSGTDTGISGVQVKLTFAGADGTLGTSDDIVYPTAAVTSATGVYSFSYLAPGQYSISIDTASAANVTALVGVQLIPSAILTGNTNPQTKTIINANVTDADFGFRVLGSIQGKVTYDNNADGAYNNPPDTGVNGWTVTLTKPDSTTVTTNTDANGDYAFSGLPYGAYTVTTTAPTNYIFSYDADDPITGTKANTPNSIAITLNTATPNPIDQSFGYKSVTGVSGIVSVDVDSNGAKNIPADRGLAGIKVAVYNAGGITKLMETITLANGAYAFDSVPAGSWDIKVDPVTIPAGYGLSYDPNGNTTGNGIGTITIAAGEISKSNIDFGYKGTASIEGSIFKDINSNGVFDGTDLKVPAGVKVTLTGGTGFVNRVTYTDGLGNYTFSDLSEYPDYKITVDNSNTTLLDGYTVASLDPVNGTTNPTLVNLAMPMGAPTGGIFAPMTGKDFGLMGAGSISGMLYQDANDNGTFEVATDIALSGITVTATNGSVIRTTTTGANGAYSLTGLVTASWTVTTNGMPINLAPSFDPDDAYQVNGNPLTPNQAILSLSTGTPSIINADFGYMSNGRVGGTVRKDELSPVGTFNMGDPGVAGIEVRLLAADGITPVMTAGGALITVTTDSTGTFQIRNLDNSQTYNVQVSFGPHTSGPLAAMTPGYDSEGGAIGIGGVVNMAAGTHTVKVAPITTMTTSNVYLGYRNDSQDIVIQKKAAKGSAKVGEIVPYTITIENRSTTNAATGILLEDLIPAGFKYVDGSVRLDGEKIANPTGGRPLHFGSIDLGISGSSTSKHTLTYFLIVGAGVTPGDYTNTAVAKNDQGNAVSNSSSAVVKIVADPLFDDSLIFGKVYIDNNENGTQDEGEHGLGGVKLVTTRGEIITTDREGRYHLTDVSGGRWDRGTNFTLKLDIRSLPQGAKVLSDNPIVVRLSPGLPSRVNFTVKLPASEVEKLEKQRKVETSEVGDELRL